MTILVLQIRIQIHVDPYRNGFSGSGSGSRPVKIVPKKKKTTRLQIEKSENHFAEGLMVFT